ncbi:shugoshin 1-like [Xenentodon cancila]
MAKERVRKKSFQESLEDIKERMKEKRTKRLAAAAAPSKARSRMISGSKGGGPNSAHTVLKGVQQNNKALAVALQAEKEKVRMANAVILQLKREQQAMFLHFLLLKRKLKEQEALAANPSTTRGNGQVHCDRERTLPSTVGVRRRRTDRSRRRSERSQEPKSLNEGDPVSDFGAIILSPVHSDSLKTDDAPRAETEIVDHSDTEEVHHSTPEPVLPKKRQQQLSRKQGHRQPRPKQEPASQKPERGRKPDRAPLKKPWENPKPRARSKSRDRSATRSKTAPPPQGSKLNTSLGFNDTFDFDCEEAVHVTPFKAKVEDIPQTTPIGDAVQDEVIPEVFKQNGSSSTSPSSESEDSLYVPQNTRRRQTSERTRVIPTRRGRPSKVAHQKENIPPKQEFSVFRDEASTPKAAETKKCEDEAHRSPASGFSNTPDSIGLEEENLQEAQKMPLEDDCLLSVSPLVEAEMRRIDNILSNFGDASSEPTPVFPQQTPHRLKTCKKRGIGLRTAGRGLSLCDVTNLSPAAYRKFSCGSSRLSDARCSTPVPTRKRRCTMTVDYKEPSLNAKLRRGDKFTDLQFLRSPIFKQKSGRRSVQKSRQSLSNQQLFDKYNESFVGCH